MKPTLKLTQKNKPTLQVTAKSKPVLRVIQKGHLNPAAIDPSRMAQKQQMARKMS